MRPAPAAPPRHRLALVAVLSALALAGCSRDLALPSPPAGPTVTGLSPAAAFAGQLVRVSGAHFDADATSNTVHFSGASARGERFDGAALIVRVPADAGDGPITVANREGTSTASADPFDYLGLGEPRRRQRSSSAPILHRAEAVYAVGGDVVMLSSLYAGLVWAGSASLTTPAITSSAADPVRGLLYYADTDPTAGTPRLVAIDAASGAVTGTAGLEAPPAQLLALPTLGLVLAFHWDSVSEREEVAAWDSDTLASVFAPSAYGIDFFFGAADVGDGRVVIAGIEPAAWDFTLALIDVGARLPPAPAAPLLSPPPIALGDGGLAPLAVGRAGGANALLGIDADAHLAAVALEDGDVAVANLDAAVPAFVLTVETWSASPIASIAGANADGALGAEVGVALATKPGDDLAVAFDLATGRLLWSVPGAAPAAASVDGAIAFVAHHGDNDVSIVNLDTGVRVARIDFDVQPGAGEYAGTAAFLPSGSGLDGDLVFPSTTFPGLLRFPTGSAEPVGVSRDPDITYVASSPDDRWVWVATAGVTPRLLGYGDGAWEVPVDVALPGGAAPQRLATRGSAVVVGHALGLSFVDGAAPSGVADATAVPGAASPAFLALGFTADGDVWTLVSRDADTAVQLWTSPAIAAGGAPYATRSVPGTALGAAWLEDGLWIFTEDDAQRAWGTLLDGALAEARTVPASATMRAIDAISPNGRLLVHRELGKTLGYVLRFYRADPGAGFPELGSLVFAERVEGLAFDGTGERLFLVTQAPDLVATVD